MLILAAFLIIQIDFLATLLEINIVFNDVFLLVIKDSFIPSPQPHVVESENYAYEGDHIAYKSHREN